MGPWAAWGGTHRSYPTHPVGPSVPHTYCCRPHVRARRLAFGQPFLDRVVRLRVGSFRRAEHDAAVDQLLRVGDRLEQQPIPAISAIMKWCSERPTSSKSLCLKS